MNSDNLSMNDPTGCLDDLEYALSLSALVSVAEDGSGPPEALNAALQLATALGYCRLYAIDPGDRDGTLQTYFAIAATDQLFIFLPRWIQEAQQLDRRWKQAADPFEADGLSTDILARRMDVLATMNAIDESYLAAVANQDPLAGSLGRAMDKLEEKLNDFDRALEAQVGILSTVVGLPLLDNWRTLLAPTLSDNMPWWLDGILEEIAATTTAVVSDVVPFSSLKFDREQLPIPADIAAGKPGGPCTHILRWSSPDGRFTARIDIPANPIGKTEITVKLLTVDGYETSDFDKATVQIPGLPLTLDERGRASCRYGELWNNAIGGLTLTVKGIAWPIVDAPSTNDPE